jgi:hypothetical protein
LIPSVPRERAGKSHKSQEASQPGAWFERGSGEIVKDQNRWIKTTHLSHAGAHKDIVARMRPTVNKSILYSVSCLASHIANSYYVWKKSMLSAPRRSARLTASATKPQPLTTYP